MLKREWDRFVNRCVWSSQGLTHCWRNEPSLKFWSIVNAISIIAALVINLSGAERAIILFAGLMILAAELMNTGVENAVDHVSMEKSPLAKAAKDSASAGVGMTVIAAGVAWLAVLIG